jgi:UDP-N-acetylglucosamine acyltransferase
LKGLNNSKAIDLIEKEISGSEERDYILDFIRNSERGIMKGYGGID